MDVKVDIIAPSQTPSTAGNSFDDVLRIRSARLG